MQDDRTDVEVQHKTYGQAHTATRKRAYPPNFIEIHLPVQTPVSAWNDTQEGMETGVVAEWVCSNVRYPDTPTSIRVVFTDEGDSGIFTLDECTKGDKVIAIATTTT